MRKTREGAAEASFVSISNMAEALRAPGAALPGAPLLPGELASLDAAHVPHVDMGGLDLTAATIARQITSSARRIVGLLPASANSDPLRLVESVGRGVVMLDGRFVVVLDPERRSGPLQDNVDGVGTAHAVAPGVIVVSPRTTMQPGAKAEGIKDLLSLARQREDTWRVVLVDLTGCALPGELLDVLPLLDGVLIVGRSGRATERDLRRSSARVPKELLMGIVLTD
ncbi:MAG: hypothetical protein IPM79_14805 [Polyangiaceae bacterium]|nr:hypothetical protein [Polyangiaceae bacterium]